MQGTVKWVDDVMFVGESGSGHSVVMDGPIELGGRNHGLRPMEMLLLGTGGCALFDVVTMLKKSRQDITNCRVELQAERADAVPAVFTAINLHFVV
ncbi:MAG: OsmC family protein, partial [Gammaproteobacteria bacterium]